MRNVLLIVAVMAAVVFALPDIAHDSCGVAVDLKEKYGAVVKDTGTAIVTYNNCFVVVKRNSPSSYYPISNYTVERVTKLKEEEK